MNKKSASFLFLFAVIFSFFVGMNWNTKTDVYTYAPNKYISPVASLTEVSYETSDTPSFVTEGTKKAVEKAHRYTSAVKAPKAKGSTPERYELVIVDPDNILGLNTVSAADSAADRMIKEEKVASKFVANGTVLPYADTVMNQLTGSWASEPEVSSMIESEINSMKDSVLTPEKGAMAIQKGGNRIPN